MTEVGPGAGGAEAMRRRILVVDDEPDIRDMIAEFFEGPGFEVLQASNGLEALVQVKRMRPDSVILDLGMPRLGGLDALKRIHAFDATMTVVIVTAEADPRIRQQALTLGATAVLDKPVNLADLLAVLREKARGVPAPSGTSPGPVEISNPSAPQPRAVPRMLVVDDDPDIRAMLQEFFRLRNYDVRVAADAPTAIRDIIQAAPDVILLDINLPGLSGVEALPAVHAIAPRAVVIMVSGSPDVDLAKRALAHGAFDYTTKPIDLEYLVRSEEIAVAMRVAETEDAGP
jgi:DNA-binding response OmpR family regulator